MASQKTVRTCGVRLKNRQERNEELRDAAFVIVAGVDNYSDAVRARRAADVEAAFPPAKASTSAAKTTSKTTTMKTTAKKTVAKATTAKASVTKSAMKSSATAKSAAKPAPASKGPTPAGMSVGPHDGDLC